jgi:hypothetical protein
VIGSRRGGDRGIDVVGGIDDQPGRLPRLALVKGDTRQPIRNYPQHLQMGTLDTAKHNRLQSTKRRDPRLPLPNSRD